MNIKDTHTIKISQAAKLHNGNDTFEKEPK